jgi:hypothetical protein
VVVDSTPTLKNLLHGHGFTFVSKDSVIKRDVIGAVALSPTVREQLSIDGSDPNFF